MQKPILLNNVKAPEVSFLDPKDFPYTDTKSQLIQEARRAARAHIVSRQTVQQILKPGVTLSQIMNVIEETTKIQLKGEKNDGIGFPTGMSMNDCAAHFTLNPNEKDIVLTENDVLKIDFGTHVNGTIMDSAFTVAFNPEFEPLLLASKEATEAGIKALGVDVRVCDIGKVIAEVMSSYELVLDGKTHKIQPVTNLNGHSIDRYCIHAGLSIPNIDNKDTSRITDNTFYAIETFATTGKAYVREKQPCSHYIYTPETGRPIHNANTKKALEAIKEKFGKLPFCPRYLDWHVQLPNGCMPSVKILSTLKNLEPYPPLYDNVVSYVSQFEHTIYLSENQKEVLTRSDDY